MQLPDLSTCDSVTVDGRYPGNLYFNWSSAWVRLTPDMIIRFNLADFHERPATNEEIAQAVAACLIHDIEAECPF